MPCHGFDRTPVIAVKPVNRSRHSIHSAIELPSTGQKDNIFEVKVNITANDAQSVIESILAQVM